MKNIVSALQQLLDTGGVFVGDDVSSRQGGWSEGPCEAMAIARPRNTGEVSAIVKLCNEYGQSIVTQGGKTGMVRGCVASGQDIALSFERMCDIEEVDTANGTMTVQAGVPLQTVQEAAAEAQLQYPMDLGARGSATLGGTISTNAGGNRVIRYGMTRQLVLGLEVVLADGTILSSMNKMIKNNAGYDLKQLFIGSEGTLGIVTRAVLKLSPALSSQQTALVALHSFEDVVSLLHFCHRGFGSQLCAFEVMWDNYFQIVTGDDANQKKSPFSEVYPFYVLIETGGTDLIGDAQTFERVLGQGLEDALVADAVLAQSQGERDALWDIRDNIEALFSHHPFCAFDISLPLDTMSVYLEEIESRINGKWPEARTIIFGHLGDGNLHVIVKIDDESDEARHQVETIVYSALEEHHGSISAEHGIGLEKRDFLHHSRNSEELSMMRLLKKTLDPKNLLNPGKLLAL